MSEPAQTAAARRAGIAVRGASGVIRDTHGALATKAFAKARRGLGPAGGPVVIPLEYVHDRITRSAYGAAGLALESAADTVEVTAARAAEASRASRVGRFTARRANAALAFAHGFNGDKIAASKTPLTYRMSLRRSGRDVPVTTDGLRTAYPDARPQVVVFVHGFVGTEQHWKRRTSRSEDGHRLSYGRRLEDQGDWSALWVRYNTGLRISTNGRDLSELLERIAEQWPVPVERIALVAHSMGGLIATSALMQWPQSATWGPLTSDIITLGTPYHGSPIEQGANFIAEQCAQHGATRWLSDVIQWRSEGIKDLRPGNLFLANTRNVLPDSAAWRELLAPEMVVRHLAVAAVLPKNPDGWVGTLIGDGVVPRDSARAGSDSDVSESTMMGGMSHMDLLNHEGVYELIARRLDAS